MRIKPVLLAVIVLGLTTATPAAADEWERTYELTGSPELTIRTDDANIIVRTWDREEVQVRLITRNGVEISTSGTHVREDQNGNRIRLEVIEPKPRISFSIVWRETRLEVWMPSAGVLDVLTGDGSVDVEGLAGSLTLESGDGSILLDEVQGEVRARTRDGSVKGHDLKGALDAYSGDGRIEVSGVFGALDVHTSDGQVIVEALGGSTVGDGWSLRSGDGRLTLRVADDLSADIEAHTGDGRIAVGAPIRATGEPHTRSLQGQLGEGGAPIVLRTSDGSIYIERLHRTERATSET